MIGVEERFWIKVDKSGECWMWTAYIRPDGYGQFRFGKRMWGAHQISYLLTYGEIPEGLWVLHDCDIRACVKPKHLYLGTSFDNMQDRAKRNKSSWPRGNCVSPSKLTEDDVRNIRQLYSGGCTNKSALGRRFSVSDVAIDYVLNKGWKHI